MATCSELHCVYLRKRYRSMSMSSKAYKKAVYECMNSWSFEQPFLEIETDSSAIKDIFRVRVDEIPLACGNGSNCNGKGKN